jgi:hypothetical protein
MNESFMTSGRGRLLGGTIVGPAGATPVLALVRPAAPER